MDSLTRLSHSVLPGHSLLLGLGRTPRIPYQDWFRAVPWQCYSGGVVSSSAVKTFQSDSCLLPLINLQQTCGTRSPIRPAISLASCLHRRRAHQVVVQVLAHQVVVVEPTK